MTADEAAIDRIIADLYASISGPVAQERNWDAFDSVFTQDARLAAWFPQLDGSVAEMKMTPSEYKERSGPMLVASGFSETEVNRELDVYGSIAHAFSTYRGEYTDARGEPRAIAGINSIQLVKTNDGWRVHSLIWQQAGDALPIPERYLGADR
ncbi:MAG: nuclear transport factor 2 family protein [Planctomycetota bacterium]